jgi:hypothetical protein
MSSIRQQMSEFIQGVFGFGKITKSTSSGDYDCDGEIGEATTPGCERWGDAAVLSRPPAGAEQAYIQLGDERIVFATRDRRYTITVAEGEVVVRAMGAGSPAYVRLKPNGDASIIGANIHLGAESVSTFVALASYVDARLSTIQSTFDTHTHAVTVTGSATTQSGTSLVPSSPIGTLASVKAAKTRAQ